jgi:hypothetical protein
MITTLQSTASEGISSTPFSQTKLFIRSDNAADARTLTLSGLDDASASYSESLTVAGRREVLTADLFTKVNSAALSASGYALSIYREGTKATGICYLTALPADGDTVTIGLTGFTQAYRFKGTTAAAFDVKIGATAAETATNLKKALNADGLGDGSDYHTGTTANPYVTATVANAILTLTDRIGCSRVLGWANAATGTATSISGLNGGVDGALVVTLTSSQQSGYPSIYLDDEPLTGDTLPGLTAWVSDPVAINGRRFSLHLAAENVTTAMVTSYQYSTQSTPTVWRNGLTAITSLDNNAQVITPTEIVEHIRVLINNTNSAAASVNAKVVMG